MHELIVYIIPIFTGACGVTLRYILKKNNKKKIDTTELVKLIDLYKISINELSEKTLRRITDLKQIQKMCNEDEFEHR